jgi:gamma-glutamyl-gamma-aminobutyrate hydrolase PuuD
MLKKSIYSKNYVAQNADVSRGFSVRVSNPTSLKNPLRESKHVRVNVVTQKAIHDAYMGIDVTRVSSLDELIEKFS